MRLEPGCKTFASYWVFGKNKHFICKLFIDRLKSVADQKAPILRFLDTRQMQMFA